MEQTMNYIPGRKPVVELIQNEPEKIDLVYFQHHKGGPLVKLVNMCRQNRIRYKFLNRDELARIYSGNHQGVIARISAKKNIPLDEILAMAQKAYLPVLLALDQVQDPGNVGTLARTALALGTGGIILPKDRSAYLGAGAHKASAGAIQQINISRVTNLARALDEAKNSGFCIYAARYDSDAENIFHLKINFPAILVLGNEEKGIRPNVLRRCHESLYVPMPGGFDSLNVAQAGAIMLGQFLRYALSS
jgi:23S rRNA (guanosine2251-2'-O)-methyltransferase